MGTGKREKRDRTVPASSVLTANNIRGQRRAGTAQADAYFAGCDEGHRLAREYLESLLKEKG